MKNTVLLFTILFLTTDICGQDIERTPLEELLDRVESAESEIKGLKKLKVSGYIQAQYQYADTDADGTNFKLANRRNSYEEKEFENFGRFGVRRGRIKFTFEDGLVQGVLQPDITERGVAFKDVYMNIKDPWFGTSAFRTGVFDRPFGHEIGYSSSSRESPERSRIVQTLFPDERDLGAMLILQPAKTSAWNILRLDAGLFAGNGINPQISNKMDFIGRLSVSKTVGSNMLISGGMSAYIGGVLQNDSSVYVMKNKKFELDNKSADNIGKYAKRQYFGIDAQFTAVSAAGFTALRAEYIFGEHPGELSSAFSFRFNNYAAVPQGPVYMRKIAGGYLLLAQDLGTLPFTVVAKYDWYDRNTEASGNDIAAQASGTCENDLAISTVGVGFIWRISKLLRLTAYYDIVSNETSDKLKDTADASGKITKYGWEGNRKDNVLTIRLQYKF